MAAGAPALSGGGGLLPPAILGLVAEPHQSVGGEAARARPPLPADLRLVCLALQVFPLVMLRKQWLGWWQEAQVTCEQKEAGRSGRSGNQGFKGQALRAE